MPGILKSVNNEMREWMGMFIFILVLSFADSFKVISSFEDYGRASMANPKGKYIGEKMEGNFEDLSLCFRFFEFFKQKTNLG